MIGIACKIRKFLMVKAIPVRKRSPISSDIISVDITVFITKSYRDSPMKIVGGSDICIFPMSLTADLSGSYTELKLPDETL